MSVDAQGIRVVKQLQKALEAETDRGCALMAGAFLDELLKGLLRADMVDDSSAADAAFEFNGPAGTFSSRTILAYLLGLIGPKTKRDIDLIRRIRNDFGHSAEPMDFETQSVKNRISEFHTCVQPPDAPPRKRFTNAVMGVAGLIESARHDATHATSRPDLDVEKAWGIMRAQYREVQATIDQIDREGTA